MCDKMTISAYILKIVEKDLFLRLQMTAKEMFHRHCCVGISRISSVGKLAHFETLSTYV